MFKNIPSKPYFRVNEKAQVIWADTGTVLSPCEDKDGYLRYSYRTKGKTFHVSAHRAVAEVFVSNPRPEIYNIVNHIDSNKKNNLPSNLEWTDAKGNRSHAQFTGNYNVIGEAHSQCKTSEDKIHKVCRLIELGYRNRDISCQLDIPSYQITNIKAGKSWRHISKDYQIKIPRKETISKSTLSWIKTCLEDGKNISDVLSLNKNLSSKDKDRIMSLLELVKFND